METETPKNSDLKHENLAKFLKKYHKIDNLYKIDEWLLTNIKVPIFDNIYDILIRLFFVSIVMLAWFYPYPTPISVSIMILILKSIAISIVWTILIKLIREIKQVIK